MMERLKPCPFCGGEASIDWSYHLCAAPVTYNVECRRCTAKIEYPYDSEEEAVMAWNRRAERSEE